MRRETQTCVSTVHPRIVFSTLRQDVSGQDGIIVSNSITRHSLRHRVSSCLYDAHEEFTSTELDRFECQGDPGPDFIRSQSIGACLHHFPLQALLALNICVALAVATVWRNINPQDEVTMNQQSKIHRFVNTCVIKSRSKRFRVVVADCCTCQMCASILPHMFQQGQFSLPTKCTEESCRSKSFVMIRPTARHTNVQAFRLQVSQEESSLQPGRTPRQLEVLLTHPDLVDSCRPGDTILLAC
jgi:hypothetical protein